jgi:CrcB protein
MKDRLMASSGGTRKHVSDRAIDRSELLAIACGGAIGALIRVGVAQAVPASAGSSWPWATFAVNIAGALMLGYLVTRLQERLPVSTLRRPLLGTGLCGALTTFSTVQVELLRMIDQHHYGLAGGYVFASVLGGYFAVFVSSAIVRRVRAIA